MGAMPLGPERCVQLPFGRKPLHEYKCFLQSRHPQTKDRPAISDDQTEFPGQNGFPDLETA